jgi:hypothetical protein
MRDVIGVERGEMRPVAAIKPAEEIAVDHRLQRHAPPARLRARPLGRELAGDARGRASAET